MPIWLTGLHARRIEPERMDDPSLDAARHARALRGLARLNRASNAAAILWRPIRELARGWPRPLRILDVATGAADLPIALWRNGRRSGVELELAACDRSETALSQARRSAAVAGVPLRLFRLDALADSLPDDFDVLTSSLFLHHLDEREAVTFLSRAAAAARRALLVNDLRRTRWGVWLAYGASRVLCRSDIVHTDAVLSARAAFSLGEARELAERAGLRGARVAPRWPSRFLLDWRRS